MESIEALTHALRQQAGRYTSRNLCITSQLCALPHAPTCRCACSQCRHMWPRMQTHAVDTVCMHTLGFTSSCCPLGTLAWTSQGQLPPPLPPPLAGQSSVAHHESTHGVHTAPVAVQTHGGGSHSQCGDEAHAQDASNTHNRNSGDRAAQTHASLHGGTYTRMYTHPCERGEVLQRLPPTDEATIHRPLPSLVTEAVHATELCESDYMQEYTCDNTRSRWKDRTTLA